jgi:acetyl-CoA carboxylase biotin carboxyl carrier protein
MDLNYLRKLVKIFDDSSAAELIIDEKGVKVHLARNKETLHPQQFVQMPQYMHPQPGFQTTQIQTHQPEVVAEPIIKSDSNKDNSGLHKINSPIVGTFYKAPSPDSPSYVEIGSHVNAGATLCIIEAMKLMNEIESDISGTVVDILIANAQPVEFGQPLFVIKPD